MQRVAILVALCWSLSTSAASAAALQGGKVTDGSVCDLGPDTSALVAQKVLVPAKADVDVQAEAYARLASRFIASECSDGQVLILDSKDSDDVDSKYLPQLANSVCSAAEVVRQATTSRDRIAGVSVVGFELRCRISKFAAYRAQVNAREASDPTDAFVLKMQQDVMVKAGATPAASTSPSKKDCGKMTLSSILTGGACR